MNFLADQPAWTVLRVINIVLAITAITLMVINLRYWRSLPVNLKIITSALVGYLFLGLYGAAEGITLHVIGGARIIIQTVITIGLVIGLILVAQDHDPESRS